MERFRKCRDALLAAHDEAAIERLVRECMEQVQPNELEALPKDCKHVVMGRARNIHEAAVTLLHAELALESAAADRGVLYEIAQVYAAASVRLTKL